MRDTSTQFSRLLKDRTLRTLVLAVVLIVLMGSSRPPVVTGLYPNEYWALKADWRHCADVLLVGDSRTLCGLSPKEMQKYFPDSHIYNYGFGGAWFSTEYLDKVETVLNPQSNKRTIVVGLSPHSLTKRDAKTGNFYEVISLPKCEKFFNTRLAGLAYFFEPWSLEEAIKEISPARKETHTKTTFYSDGWVSVHEVPCSIEKGIRKYTGFYRERLVDPSNVDNVIHYVDKWVKRGTIIYGFIPPSCQEMYDLETKVSGLNEQELIRRFKEAGGIWIDTDPGAYYSFDGSHLQDEDALEFTNDFCKELIKHENPKITRVNDTMDKLNN